MTLHDHDQYMNPFDLHRALKIASSSNKAAMAIKGQVKSVVYKPLLLTPPKQNTGGSMHVSQGLMTHLTKRILGMLQEIDRKASWWQQVSEAVNDTTNCKKDIEERILDMHRKDRTLYNQIQSAARWGTNVPAQTANLLLPANTSPPSAPWKTLSLSCLQQVLTYGYLKSFYHR